MRLIAKRGLFNGPDKDKENTREQIKLAISKGFYVEVDARWTDNGWFLGHDEPKEKVDVRFFDHTHIFTHCKTRETYDKLIKSPYVKAFFHEEEDYALVSKSDYKWQHGRLGKYVYQKRSNGDWEKIGTYRDNFRLTNVLLDFDGVFSGSKTYCMDGSCISKDVKDSTWTAIKRMKAAGLNISVVSGDSWNSEICYKRGIRFIKTDTLGKNSKLNTLNRFGLNLEESVYIGDDWYDIELLNAVGFAYCPSDAIHEVKLESQVLPSIGGGNVIADLYEDLIRKGLVARVAPIEG